MSDLMSASKDDKVGLYRVGWSDPSEFITFECVADKLDERSAGLDELSILFSGMLFMPMWWGGHIVFFSSALLVSRMKVSGTVEMQNS